MDGPRARGHPSLGFARVHDSKLPAVGCVAGERSRERAVTPRQSRTILAHETTSRRERSPNLKFGEDTSRGSIGDEDLALRAQGDDRVADALEDGFQHR